MRLTRLVASTKLSEREFWNRSLLGKSLLAMPEVLRPDLWIRFDNGGKWGLPEIYNRAIEACPPELHLLFVHDDVFLHDCFLQHRIAEGLLRYEVIGLAGSRGSDPSMPSWGLAFDENLKPTGWQDPEKVALSGAVSHVSRYHDPALEVGVVPRPNLSLYGTLPAECDLLDGLFLAVNGGLAREWGVRFDERLRFHLYDLDFCRTARARKMRLGTWPILASHGSGGNFDSAEFRAAARIYLEKWRRGSQNDASVVGEVPGPPHLVRCDLCQAVVLPENLVAHAVWHRDQHSKALSDLRKADDRQQTANSGQQTAPDPESELSAVCCELPAARDRQAPGSGAAATEGAH